MPLPKPARTWIKSPSCGTDSRISDTQKAAIREWAEGDPYVREVRIFGSRAKGKGRLDSDLDIAITASVGNYTRFDSEWKAELERRTGLRVGLSQYNNPVNDTVRRYCDDPSTILIFQRPEGPHVDLLTPE